MHEETIRDLIENGTGVVGSLLKEMMVHRNRIDVLEQQKEKELELARTRNQVEQQVNGGGGQPQTQPQPQTGGGQVSAADGAMHATPAEVEAALDELIDEEMCATCKELLEALKERPARQQVRGIMEYGTFKHNLDGGAGVEEMKEVLRETDVLQDVFRERFTAAGQEL